MKLKMFKISIIAIIVILTTTFIFIGKINSSKNNLSKNSTSNTESKEKVKQKITTIYKIGVFLYLNKLKMRSICAKIALENM